MLRVTLRDNYVMHSIDGEADIGEENAVITDAEDVIGIKRTLIYN